KSRNSHGKLRPNGRIRSLISRIYIEQEIRKDAYARSRCSGVRATSACGQTNLKTIREIVIRSSGIERESITVIECHSRSNQPVADNSVSGRTVEVYQNT